MKKSNYYPDINNRTKHLPSIPISLDKNNNKLNNNNINALNTRYRSQSASLFNSNNNSFNFNRRGDIYNLVNSDVNEKYFLSNNATSHQSSSTCISSAIFSEMDYGEIREFNSSPPLSPSSSSSDSSVFAEPQLENCSHVFNPTEPYPYNDWLKTHGENLIDGGSPLLFSYYNQLRMNCPSNNVFKRAYHNGSTTNSGFSLIMAKENQESDLCITFMKKRIELRKMYLASMMNGDVENVLQPKLEKPITNESILPQEIVSKKKTPKYVKKNEKLLDEALDSVVLDINIPSNNTIVNSSEFIEEEEDDLDDEEISFERLPKPISDMTRTKSTLTLTIPDGKMETERDVVVEEKPSEDNKNTETATAHQEKIPTKKITKPLSINSTTSEPKTKKIEKPSKKSSEGSINRTRLLRRVDLNDLNNDKKEEKTTYKKSSSSKKRPIKGRASLRPSLEITNTKSNLVTSPRNKSEEKELPVKKEKIKSLRVLSFKRNEPQLNLPLLASTTSLSTDIKDFIQNFLHDYKETSGVEVEYLSSLYSFLKGLAINTNPQPLPTLEDLFANEPFLNYLKHNILISQHSSPEVLLLTTKIMRLLCEYSCIILNISNSKCSTCNFSASFIYMLKIIVKSTRLIELGFVDILTDKLWRFVNMLVQNQQNAQVVLPFSENIIYKTVIDILYSISVLAQSARHIREKLLLTTSFYPTVIKILNLKKSSIKSHVLICIEKIILSTIISASASIGECVDLDDGTIKYLIDGGFLKELSVDLSYSQIEKQRNIDISKKKKKINIRQVFYQLLRTLSVNERARNEMYQLGFFHSLLSMLRDESEEENLKLIALEIASNFVPSSNINCDALFLKYVFDTIVGMFEKTSRHVLSNEETLPNNHDHDTLIQLKSLHILSHLSDYSRTHDILGNPRILKIFLEILVRDISKQSTDYKEGMVVTLTSATFLATLLLSNLSKTKEGQQRIFKEGLNSVIRSLRLVSLMAEYQYSKIITISATDEAPTKPIVLLSASAMTFEEFELLPKVITKTIANMSTFIESHTMLFKETVLDSLSSLILYMKEEKTVVWNCLCTVSNLCESDPILQQKLISKVNIKSCLLFYLLEDSDPKLQGRAMRCVAKLAKNEMLLIFINETFKLHNIVKSIEHNEYEECKLDGLRILAQFSQFEQFHIPLLECDTIELLVKSTHSSIDAIVIEALKSLLNLIYANDHNVKELLVKAGTIERIWELKRNHKSSETVKRLCTTALKGL
ncbi:hypothetical protein ABK040_015524 [Willaertia magna]